MENQVDAESVLAILREQIGVLSQEKAILMVQVTNMQKQIEQKES